MNNFSINFTKKSSKSLLFYFIEDLLYFNKVSTSFRTQHNISTYYVNSLSVDNNACDSETIRGIVFIYLISVV